jgi:hypothetical protein
MDIMRRINMTRKRRSLKEGEDNDEDDDDDGIGEQDEEGNYDHELIDLVGSIKDRINLYFSKFEVLTAVPMQNYYLLGCAAVYSGRTLAVFRSNPLLQSSELLYLKNVGIGFL